MLCKFRLLQTQWRWLLSTQNGVDQRDRPALFAWVKKLVYAPTEMESCVQYVVFIYCVLLCCKYVLCTFQYQRLEVKYISRSGPFSRLRRN